MQFDFVLIAFASHAAPPLGSTFKASSKAYRLAPLAGDGPIYTADVGLWSQQITGNENEETFCPRRASIARASRLAESDGCHFVMALTQAPEFNPPGSPGVRLQLESLPLLIDEFGTPGLTDVGFDVIDQWTGLSAVANVGYSPENLSTLAKLGLRTNKFGLFATADEALQFANFASVAASEHAPFVPVKNMVRMPR